MTTEMQLLDSFTIPTASGRLVRLCDPRPGDIVLSDVAFALARQCRFNGVLDPNRFYSVAEHSVLCSDVAQPEHKVAALLHDASEAYVGDMIRPLKVLLRSMGQHGFDDVEARWSRAVEARFGLRDGAIDHPTIKAIDEAVCATEQLVLRQAFLPAGWAPRVSPAEVMVTGWTWSEAAQVFLLVARNFGLTETMGGA